MTFLVVEKDELTKFRLAFVFLLKTVPVKKKILVYDSPWLHVEAWPEYMDKEED
jgi:hypothetical protein